MVIPVGTRFYQTLELWKKSKKGCKVQEVLPVVFVPLKGQQGWKENEW